MTAGNAMAAGAAGASWSPWVHRQRTATTSGRAKWRTVSERGAMDSPTSVSQPSKLEGTNPARIYSVDRRRVTKRLWLSRWLMPAFAGCTLSGTDPCPDARFGDWGRIQNYDSQEERLLEPFGCITKGRLTCRQHYGRFPVTCAVRAPPTIPNGAQHSPS